MRYWSIRELQLVPCRIYIDATGENRGDLFDVRSNSLLASLRAARRRELMLAHLENTLAVQAPYCVDCRDWRAIPLPNRGRSRALATLKQVADG